MIFPLVDEPVYATIVVAICPDSTSQTLHVFTDNGRCESLAAEKSSAGRNASSRALDPVHHHAP